MITPGGDLLCWNCGHRRCVLCPYSCEHARPPAELYAYAHDPDSVWQHDPSSPDCEQGFSSMACRTQVQGTVSLYQQHQQ